MSKISIVTLSYNQGRFLRECILSVLQQNHENLELIIVDPGSIDSSREIALEFAKFDSRVKLIFENDNGPSDGLNKGFEKATGEIIGCLNADDYYLPSIFGQVISEFNLHPNADCIYSHGFILRNERLKFQSSDKFDLSRYFSNRGLILQQSTFFRLSTIKARKISFNVANRTCWDGEFLVDLARSGGNFKRVFGKWGVFRIYDDSITGSGKLHELTKLDHSRILENQKLLGFELSLLENLNLKIKLFSIFRRIRNILFHILLTFILK